MGNTRMRTKPVVRQEEKLHTYVKNTVEAIMKQCGTAGITTHSIEVPFGATIKWEEKPTFTHPHWTKVIFYGYTRFERAFAHYEGEFGVWEIDLALWGGPLSMKRLLRGSHVLERGAKLSALLVLMNGERQ